MTLFNMAIEFAALTGIIAPDEQTYAYLAGWRCAPAAFDEPYWRGLCSDTDAVFDREIAFDAGDEGFLPGSRTISSTNCNFEGRQGPGIRTHIASPETVAAGALVGCIADPRKAVTEMGAA